MSSRLTNYGKRYMTETLFGQTVPVLSVYYVALVKTAPNTSVNGDTLDEPNGGSYARVAVTNTDANWDISGWGTVFATNAITFAAATSDWGKIRYYALCTQSTGGDVILYGQFDSAPYVSSGDIVVISADTMRISAYSGTLL